MKSVGLLVIIMLVLCGNAYAERTVWYVHPDSTLNTVQAGLDSCADNDIVLVGPGIYFENISWPATQGIDLISEHGPDTTIIDGDSAGRVINISFGVDTTTVIRGFTIQNGYGVLDGAGIYCYGASPRIVSNVFTANGAHAGYFGGGAIACRSNSHAVVDSNVMVGNYGTWGGAILLFNDCDATITNNLIEDNSADTTGGGIFCYLGCDATIAENIIINNSARWGGGIGIMNNSSPIVNDNVISSNIATTMGGGIYCYIFVSPTITHNIITENTCNLYGAGIRCSPNTSGVIRHCIISNNYGWGIGIRESSPDIDSCAIEYNTNRGVYILTGANPTINWCNIVGNQGYGIFSTNASVTVDAENNWWGDASGPGGVGPGTGNPVSNYVDYDPWLTSPGVEEQQAVKSLENQINLGATLFRGPLQLPKGKKCKVFDITGRVIEPDKIQPGIYFIEIDGVFTQKVVKVR